MAGTDEPTGRHTERQAGRRAGRGATGRPGRLRRWLRRENGNSTIEFVIIFPIFMTIFISTFEAGMMMVRQVMLDRATDISVRALRLGSWATPTHEQLKRNICGLAAILPDCMNSVLVELRPVSTTTWTPLPANPTCIDRDAIIQPVTTFDGGQQNEMMLVRVCVLVKPMFPTTGLGLRLPEEGEDYYSLVSTSAFVNEPRS
jgi:Flp pilus assembly protein TadG